MVVDREAWERWRLSFQNNIDILNQLQSLVGKVDSNVTNVREDVGELKVDVRDLRKDMTKITIDSIAQKEQLNHLTGRVTKIESKSNGFDQEILNASKTIAEIRNQTTNQSEWTRSKAVIWSAVIAGAASLVTGYFTYMAATGK